MFFIFEKIDLKKDPISIFFQIRLINFNNKNRIYIKSQCFNSFFREKSFKKKNAAIFHRKNPCLSEVINLYIPFDVKTNI
jgi:hypothetical protein